MKILGIETSCDETGASVIEVDEKNKKVKLLSNVLSSSINLHAKTGGIIPDIAAREQVKYMIPVLEKAMEVLASPKDEIDAIAVTVGPGLIGSLLIGVETARTMAYVFNKPVIPINHLFGHIYANWIDNKEEIEFPVIALVVSGGHTDLVLIKNHKNIKWLGGTKDDAAGEAFDKTGRLLNLPYPGGPQIEKMAQGLNKDIYNFPRPMIYSKDFDFSFSGLKAAVFREVEKIGKNLDLKATKNISYSLQEAIFEVLIKKTIKAARVYNAKSIILGGGVAANQTLRKYFENFIKKEEINVKLYIPSIRFCTDNAAMIATAGFFNREESSWEKISANPELYFD